MMPVASALERAFSRWHREPAGDEWTFTVWHGVFESAADVDRVEQLRRLAGRTGHLKETRGTTESTTWIFDADGGRAAVLAMQAEAVMTGRFWWKTHTRFGADR